MLRAGASAWASRSSLSVVGIPQECGTPHVWYNLLEQFEPLRRRIVQQQCDTSRIATWVSKAGRKSKLYRVSTADENNRYRRGRLRAVETKRVNDR
jgi:hypothetical protein